jgi:two-component system, OmpR family, sensor histidine kinase KdpD
LLAYLRRRHPHEMWDTAERIMVAITAAHGTDSVMRRAARLSARMKGDLYAVHVISGEQSRQRDADALDALHKLADDLGAHWHEVTRDDPARALVDFASEHQVTQIVLGSSRRSRWEEMTKGSVVQRVLRFASDSGVDVHVIANRDVDDASVEVAPS